MHQYSHSHSAKGRTAQLQERGAREWEVGSVSLNPFIMHYVRPVDREIEPRCWGRLLRGSKMSHFRLEIFLSDFVFVFLCVGCRKEVCSIYLVLHMKGNPNIFYNIFTEMLVFSKCKIKPYSMSLRIQIFSSLMWDKHLMPVIIFNVNADLKLFYLSVK